VGEKEETVMLTIRFGGEEYLFTGNRLEDGGAITTPTAYQEGTVSYAHLGHDGLVRRFREVIGTAQDIEIIGSVKEPELSDGWLGNVFRHPSWDR
jgi:hypothetical protein